ncbi:MAG: peroxiredoxin [Alphaproteobacteria bacterium]|nr:MAG: peroxiredoxin [Alphaproteobacteria bacterium]
MPAAVKPEAQDAAAPFVGDKAPDFTLPALGAATDTVRLRDLLDHWVVLYFYPKDNTSGCTVEACDFRDSFATLKRAGALVVGVSRDSLKSHQSFQTKHDLPFILAADEDGATCQAYGVWVGKSMYGRSYMGIERSTFLIDPKGRIHHLWRKVKIPGHVQDVLEVMNKGK